MRESTIRVAISHVITMVTTASSTCMRHHLSQAKVGPGALYSQTQTFFFSFFRVCEEGGPNWAILAIRSIHPFFSSKNIEHENK